MQTELAGTPVEKVKELHTKRKELKRELKLYKPKVAPVEHALIQKQIGDVYFQLAEIQTIIDQHPWNALKAYENALYYYSAETNPAVYLEIRFAWYEAMRISARSRGWSFFQKHVKKGIADIEQVLGSWSGEKNSHYGKFYMKLALMRREVSSRVIDRLMFKYMPDLNMAVEYTGQDADLILANLKEALRYCTADDDPMDYADVQGALGGFYNLLYYLEKQKVGDSSMEWLEAMAKRQGTTEGFTATMPNVPRDLGNLKRAIHALHEGLRFYTYETKPEDYAVYASQLGSLYLELYPHEKNALYLQNAEAALLGTLRFWDRQLHAMDFALTQESLAKLYEFKGETSAMQQARQLAADTMRALDMPDVAENILAGKNWDNHTTSKKKRK